MSHLSEVADVLERAADGFESGRYGWVRGCSYKRDSEGNESYCATGALHFEAGVRNMLGKGGIDTSLFQARCQVYLDADRALCNTVEKISVLSWNDYFAKDVSEVVEKMKEAAKTLRNKEGESA